jgi:hypothetical protein
MALDKQYCPVHRCTLTYLYCGTGCVNILWVGITYRLSSYDRCVQLANVDLEYVRGYMEGLSRRCSTT